MGITPSTAPIRSGLFWELPLFVHTYARIIFGITPYASTVPALGRLRCVSLALTKPPARRPCARNFHGAFAEYCVGSLFYGSN
jgi:hypothetical protein